MSGPTASNPFDVCGMLVARKRETSSSVIPRLQACDNITAKEKSTTSSQGTLWEDVLL
jgi:hypothetical protein